VLADKLTALAGWRRAGLVLALGGLLGWFHAPYNYWPLGFVCFPLFLWILSPLRGWAAFRAGWLFGFGYFLFGLYWIAHALFVDIVQFWWALPLAVAGLPMVLALYVALVAVLTQRWARPGLRQALLFALLWSIAEWLRGHLFTGFPWLLYGYVWNDVAVVRQLAALLGVYGLSFVAVLLACLPVAWSIVSQRRVMGATALVLVALVWGWGLYWQSVPATPGPQLTLRLVQPNIEQTLKLDPAAREEQLIRLLTHTAVPGKVDAVIWPESAVPYRLTTRPDIRARIAANLPAGSVLLTGVVRDDGDKFYNSLIAMDGQGQVLGAYDKAHLVPFGEYIPFRQWLPFDPIAGAGEFSAGPGPQSLSFRSLPKVSPLICYEVIFPGAVSVVTDRPDWLLNITNDAWYGLTHGPYQHLQIARLRAVEEGRVLVRSANSGISAIIRPDGQVQSSLPLGIGGVLDSDIQLEQKAAPFASYGSAGVVLLWLLTGVAFFLAGRRSELT